MNSAMCVGRVVEPIRFLFQPFGCGVNHRLQVQILVGDMDRQDAIWLEMPEVQGKGFASQKMDRDGITRESIHREHIKLLRLFCFQ